MILAEILGPDMLIVVAIVALLFGGKQLPKLARSLGSAKSEFEKGIQEGEHTDGGHSESAVSPAADEQITMTRAELEAKLAEAGPAHKEPPPES